MTSKLGLILVEGITYAISKRVIDGIIDKIKLTRKDKEIRSTPKKNQKIEPARALSFYNAEGYMGFIFAVGIIVGCILTLCIRRVKSIGVIRVDNSIPEDTPYIFLELSKPTEYLIDGKYVILKVSTKNYISQK